MIPEHQPTKAKIIQLLKEKACTKQKVYQLTINVFQEFKQEVSKLADELEAEMKEIDEDVRIAYEDKGELECMLTFGGDTLIFTMHTNVFTFNEEHFIHKSSYVKQDDTRSYCGVIQMYNFLADSFKYRRTNDIGYLIGRIFVNKDRHFFVEGKKRLAFLFNNFDEQIVDTESIRSVVEAAIIYTINFDLLTPPFQSMQTITLSDKMAQTGLLAVQTGKRLGFRFEEETE